MIIFNRLRVAAFARPVFTAVALLAIAGTGRVAHAQFGSYRGNRYSSGTNSSTTYTSFSSQTKNTTISTKTTQTTTDGNTTRNLNNVGGTDNRNKYFAYNVAAVTDGVLYPGGNDPDGYLFTGGLVQTGTGAGGNASVTYVGATTGTNLAFNGISTWIKGATESAGNWNVQTSTASVLGGYTDATHTGSLTMNLGANYTSFGTLIGTNPGANLNVEIVGYSGTTEIFRYQALNITSSPANPTFTGYISKSSFNKVVITGLTSSTGAANATYPDYPNAAYITVDQFQVGFQAVPEPGSVAFLACGGLAGLGVVSRSRKRR